MVGVGVDEVLAEGQGLKAAVNALGEILPVERGGELEGEVSEGLGAGVADGEAGADGDVGFGRDEVDVEIVGGEGEGGAVGVGDGVDCFGRCCGLLFFFFRLLGCVLVSVEEDGALGCGRRWRRFGSGGLRGLSEGSGA